MKKIQLYILFIVTSFFIQSCEDVVNVDLDTAEPKLVIDAVINWQKGTLGSNQKIKLTTTTNFYSDVIPPANGATVTIQDITSTTTILYTFNEVGTSGEYICSNFEPIINNNYKLTILYKGETYTSTSKLFATPEIESVKQTLIPGFSTKEINKIEFFFQDNGTEDNFYLVGVKNNTIFYPEYGVISDEFFQGNLMFGLYIDEDLKKGDVLNLSVQGISEKYNNYMLKLLNIAGSDGGSPFATPPATLRGNIINETNPENYPFGYFHLSEIDTDTYSVQ